MSFITTLPDTNALPDFQYSERAVREILSDEREVSYMR
jgi:hypothetical protein